MLKAIAAGFLGSLLALVAAGAIGFLLAERTVRTMAAEISQQVEGRLADARERAAAVPLRERAGAGAQALAEALEAGRGRKALLVAFGECVAQRADGERAPAAVEECLRQFDWVEP